MVCLAGMIGCGVCLTGMIGCGVCLTGMTGCGVCLTGVIGCGMCQVRSNRLATCLRVESSATKPTPPPFLAREVVRRVVRHPDVRTRL